MPSFSENVKITTCERQQSNKSKTIQYQQNQRHFHFSRFEFQIAHSRRSLLVFWLNKWDNNVSGCVRNKSTCMCSHSLASLMIGSVMCIVKCLSAFVSECVYVWIAFAICIYCSRPFLFWNEHLNIDNWHTHTFSLSLTLSFFIVGYWCCAPLAHSTHSECQSQNKGKIQSNRINVQREYVCKCETQWNCEWVYQRHSVHMCIQYRQISLNSEWFEGEKVKK